MPNTAVARGRRVRPVHVWIVAGFLATGCAGASRGVRLDEAGRGDGWARVERVPEVRQKTENGCGAAALAMVLGHWGLPVAQDDVWAASPPQPKQGLRADALRAFARGQGLQAFLIEGAPADLEREVARDRPVLVGVVKKAGRRLYPHYEVVVGINRAANRILTLDPARGARETRLDAFAKEWAAAGRLTLVVFPPLPGAPPPGPEATPAIVPTPASDPPR